MYADVNFPMLRLYTSKSFVDFSDIRNPIKTVIDKNGLMIRLKPAQNQVFIVNVEIGKLEIYDNVFVPQQMTSKWFSTIKSIEDKTN